MHFILALHWHRYSFCARCVYILWLVQRCGNTHIPPHNTTHIPTTPALTTTPPWSCGSGLTSVPMTEDGTIFNDQRGLHSMQRNILHLRNTFIISTSSELLQGALFSYPRTIWVDEDSFTFSNTLQRGWYFDRCIQWRLFWPLNEHLKSTNLPLATLANI